MSPKERFLKTLLYRPTKERWIAGVLLSAPAEILKNITAKDILVSLR